jgi:hypothetical protein
MASGQLIAIVDATKDIATIFTDAAERQGAD